MIYKLFSGRHIDLSKLISVSEIFQDEIGCKAFNLEFELMEYPIMIRFNSVGNYIPDTGKTNHVFVYNADNIREVIITTWKNFKEKP
jgi:hypothetical protein